jgi:uncharacterized protein (TIGR02118 family)
MLRVFLFIDRGESSAAYARDVLLPLLRELPGVRRLDAARVIARATGDVRAEAVVDLSFDSEEEMNVAFASAAGRRVSREIMNNASAGLEMVTAESLAG